MAAALSICSIIIIACVIGNKISSKFGVPMLLAFIVLGMLFGSDGIFKIRFENFEFAEQICSVALIFIMFYGGFGTKWKTAKPVVLKSLLLSSVGVLITAALLGLFCYLVLDFGFLEGMLIGAVLSSTDAASVFSILRSKKLSLKHNTDSMLELESGSNDPCAYMLTVIILSVMSETGSAGEIIYSIFAQIFFGVLIGFAVAAGAVWVFKNFNFETAGFDSAFMLAVAILSFALPALIGGNGYLSAYIVGIVLGNKPINNKKELVHFFDGITSLMQMLIFFLLGLLAFPSHLSEVLVPSLIIAVFLTFAARPVAVCAILAPFRSKVRQLAVVSWAGLRGAASIVFAIMATVSEAYTKSDLFHIVFCVVLISIAFQGTLLPVIAKKLDMIDYKGNIFKTFNDYADESELQYIQVTVNEETAWAGKTVAQLSLPSDLLIVMLVRDGEHLVPNGSTLIQDGDVMVLSGSEIDGESHIKLTEKIIAEDDEWNYKTLSEITLPRDHLVMMIKRDSQTIIPNGDTGLRTGDVLVINTHKGQK